MSKVRFAFLNARNNLLFFIVTISLNFFARRVFLDEMGISFIGLTTTINSILAFFAFAEMGFGQSASFFLYRPLQQGNQREVNEILSLIKEKYKRIAKFILVGGILFSFFIPFIFENKGVETTTIYALFFSFLFSNTLYYFFIHKQSLLIADQKTYLLTVRFGLLTVGKILLQIAFLHYFDYKIISFITIEFIFGGLKIIVLNHLAAKTYPWLKIEQGQGERTNLRAEIAARAKQIFAHDIARTVLNSADQLFILVLTNLKNVGIYNNYILIIQGMVNIFQQPFVSVNSGIGHLIAEGNVKKNLMVFNQLFVARFWAVGIVFFCLYNLVPVLIFFWLKHQLLLPQQIFIILLVNCAIAFMKQPTEAFINGFGLFNDVWSSVIEVIVNISFSLFLGLQFGIKGVLLGSTIGLVAIGSIWKPYFLFAKGFNINFSIYWSNYLILLLILTASWFISINFLQIDLIDNFLDTHFFVYRCVAVTFSMTITFSLLLILFSKHFRYLLTDILSRFKKEKEVV